MSRPEEPFRPLTRRASFVDNRLPTDTSVHWHDVALRNDMDCDKWVRLRLINQTMMFHPMHLHGHTLGLVAGGARKDTVSVRPMQTLEVDLDTDNPGQWALHCHNILHAETGMMTTLPYRT